MMRYLKPALAAMASAVVLLAGAGAASAAVDPSPSPGTGDVQPPASPSPSPAGEGSPSPSPSPSPVADDSPSPAVSPTPDPSPTASRSHTHRPRPPRHHGHGSAGDLTIGLVGYNALGPDVATNRNQEYVDISNTSRHAVDVAGLVLEDAWARAHRGSNPRRCNTFTVTTLDGGATGLLPAGHTLRIYTGSGVPVPFGVGRRMHAVYMDSHCGYHGHYLNNAGDVVYVTLGGKVLTKPFDFHHGYWVR